MQPRLYQQHSLTSHRLWNMSLPAETSKSQLCCYCHHVTLTKSLDELAAGDVLLWFPKGLEYAFGHSAALQ